MLLTSPTGTLEAGPTVRSRMLRVFVSGVLLTLMLACPHASLPTDTGFSLPHDALARVRASGKLRAVSRVNPATFVVDRYGPAGIEYELARDFAASLGVELEMIPAATIGEAYAALDAGRADIAASGLTERRLAERPYTYSSSYLGVSQQVVFRTGTEKPSSLADIAGKRVMVLSQSSSAEALRRAQASLPGLGWMESTRTDTADLLRRLTDGEIDHAVVKSHEFYMHAGLFPAVEIAFELPEPEELAWALSESADNRRLFSAMQEFLTRREQDGGLDLLRERFFGYLPDINRKALNAFAARAEKQLPKLEPLMRRIGAEEGIDWHLLAAMSYQESHWNPSAVSRKGAAGMMMLTTRAASEVGVRDRRNMEQSLRGGARYFRKLMEELDGDISPADRELFALAAYNMGPAHLADARRLAGLRGANPDLWSDVEDQLPLLAKREWHVHTEYGYARGLETASFVNGVRQYHRFLEHHEDPAGLFALTTREPTPRASGS
jgi:membrane-bound lytic murein transglycosylase F